MLLLSVVCPLPKALSSVHSGLQSVVVVMKCLVPTESQAWFPHPLAQHYPSGQGSHLKIFHTIAEDIPHTTSLVHYLFLAVPCIPCWPLRTLEK